MFFTQHMRLIVLFITIMTSFTSLYSFALTYDGIITKRNTQILFTDSANKKSYRLTSTSVSVTSDLNKLNSGDFISLEGLKNPAQPMLTVAALNYFGLKALLGIWVGDDTYCYNFSGFTEFSISPRPKKTKCSDSVSPYYTYIVSPTTNSWAILISSEKNSYVGELKFISATEIQIELFDSETGDTLRTLRLRK